jgi:hypothetical protein
MTTEPDPHQRRRGDDGDDDDSMAEGIEQQAEFEQLVREKDDWQEAVDAQRRGEKPSEDPAPPATA